MSPESERIRQLEEEVAQLRTDVNALAQRLLAINDRYDREQFERSRGVNR